jgi:polyisoprenoid-binding protein YceI
MTTTTKLSELTGDYTLDPARTRVGFVARSIGVIRVRGYFGEFEGSSHLDGGDPGKSSTWLTIAATSIQTGNRQRDDHLRDRFLAAGSHPAITFSLTKAAQAGETSFKVTGDLSLRGVTRPVTMDVELTGADSGQVTLTGKARINRKDWGVNWPATLGTVSQHVTVEFEAVLTPRP